MKRIIFTVFTLTISCFNILFGSYNKEFSNNLFKEANKLYENGDVKKANTIYKKLAEEDEISSADLYYNLATTYELLGESGEAVLWYERLLLINPFDKEAFSRLSLIIDGYTNNLKFLYIIVHVFLYIFLLSFTILAVLFVLSVASIEHKQNMRKIMYFVSFFAILFLMCTVFSQMLYNKGYINTVKDNISLYKGNNLASDSLKVLNNGSKLEILEEYDLWYYVKARNGDKGWIYKLHSEKI